MRNSSHRRFTEAERIAYDHMRNMGIEMYIPHKMSAQEQVEAMSLTNVLVGFSGSTLHNAIFMREGTTVIKIVDSPGQSSANPTQKEICKMRNQNLVFVSRPDLNAPIDMDSISAKLQTTATPA